MRPELKRGDPRQRKRENRGDSLSEHDRLKGFRVLGALRAPGPSDDRVLGPEGPQHGRPKQRAERPDKWQRFHGRLPGYTGKANLRTIASNSSQTRLDSGAYVR